MSLVRKKQLWNTRVVFGVFTTVLLLLAWWSNTASAYTGDTIYVATTGNNGNSGSKSQPLRTIQRAIDKASAGDTIYVRGGTYNESLLITKSGTAQNPIRLHAFPGELPVIDGRYTLPTGTTAGCSDVTPKHCFVYKPLVSIRGSHWEFSGFKVIRSHGRGIGVSSPRGTKTRNVLVDSCIVDGARSAGIHVLNSTGVTVQRCDVSNAANFATHSRSAQQLNWPVIVNVVGSDYVMIRKNKIHESWGEGVAAGRNSTHVTIEDNVIFDNYALQIYVQRSQDVIVQRNLVYHTNAPQFRRGGNPSSCIVINNESGFSGSLVTNRIKVVNNVATGCGQGIAIWGNSGSDVRTSNVQINHNVVANAIRNTATTPVGILVNPRAKLYNISVRKNVVLQDTGHSVYLPSTSAVSVVSNIWSRLPKVGGSGTNNQIADPQLRNPYQTLRPDQVQVDWFKPKSGSLATSMGAGPYEYVSVSTAGMPSLATAPVGPSAGNPQPGPTPTPPTENTNAPQPLVLYEFKENSGSTIRDVSNNAERIDLNINKPSAVRWTQGGLKVVQPVIIRSSKPARQLASTCRDSGELTIDMTVTPANVQQDGPARILTMSSGTLSRNFTVGQGQWRHRPKDVFDIRLRTSETNTNGEPSLVSSRGAVTTAKTHLFYTRQSDGTTQLFVNGNKVATGRVLGDLKGWYAGFSLLLANEASGNRPWLGTYHRVAVYCEALNPPQQSNIDNRTAAADFDLLDIAAPSPDELDVTNEQLDQMLKDFELSPDGNLLQPDVFLPFVSQ